MCKILKQSGKYFQRYAPETKCSRTAQRRNIIISPLRPCVLNLDLKYFNLSIIHQEVTHIPIFFILAYFLTKFRQKKKRRNGGGIHSSLRLTCTVTAGAKNMMHWLILLKYYKIGLIIRRLFATIHVLQTPVVIDYIIMLMKLAPYCTLRACGIRANLCLVDLFTSRGSSMKICVVVQCRVQRRQQTAHVMTSES